MESYNPNRPELPETKQILKLAAQDHRLDPQPWGGISLPGGGGRAPLMMSMAGGTAPDIYYCWFHIIRNDIHQQFLHPLNEWIGDDTNGDGQISDAEAKWDGWKDVPQLWRQVATENGKVYGVPYAGWLYFGLIFRKDLVREAGLDPEHPPETWDQFFYWSQKLTVPGRAFAGARLQRGQRAIALYDKPWAWLPWMQAAGGSPVIQSRTSPTTRKTYDFAMETTHFVAPDTGEDLDRAPSTWRAAFDSPAGLESAAFYQKMMWAPWIRDPQTGEPVNLTEADVARGSVMVATRTIAFKPDAVIRGVARAVLGTDDDPTQLIRRGEIAFYFANFEQLRNLSSDLGLPPELVGMMWFPARDATCKPVLQVHKHFYVMSAQVGKRPKAERDCIWRCLTALTSAEARDENIRHMAMEGSAMWCQPADLKRLGLTAYLDEVPDLTRRMFERIDRGEIALRTEPFVGFWQTASDLLQRNVLGRILSENGRNFDYTAALQQATTDANNGLMFERSRAALDQKRPQARVLAGLAAIVLLICTLLIIRERRANQLAAQPIAGVRTRGWLPVLMLAPAVLSIAIWSYYPLLRGLVMAFQDYHIAGSSPWVGLDNFIAVATDSNFWMTVLRTCKYAFLMLALGFLVPIFLALLLTEVPRGKILFRTLFFLPHMTSGIVVVLMWKLMYDPTENGLLNQFLALFHLHKKSWLQDPAWAMACCILPGVWAGAGIASLIYVAALSSLPEEYYEAAALDGAGLFARFRHVCLPQIMPLIVINFVGAFIGAFQAMSSIFLLTFGGPGDATMVLGMSIWKEAYNNLRFSTATTMAWFMGVGLIGFTYLQIRILRRIEFRRAEEN